MELELTSDRYPPITNQTRYPLRHVASSCKASLFNLFTLTIPILIVILHRR